MRDLGKLLLVLTLAVPGACTRDVRDTETPVRAVAGNDQGPPGSPAPSITNEPTVPGVPNASEGAATPAGLNPTTAFVGTSSLSQPTVGPGAAGNGGALGTGGSGFGGANFGGNAGGGMGSGNRGIGR
jgi:hypothetical protein